MDATGANGIEYESFIVDVASGLIQSLLSSDEEMQVYFNPAAKQLRAIHALLGCASSDFNAGNKLTYVSLVVQYKRTAAWNQVQQAEEQAELVLGMDKDEFTRIMGSVFHEFDADQSGFLDAEEFERAIAGCGIPFSPSQIRMLMAAADVNDLPARGPRFGLLHFPVLASV